MTTEPTSNGDINALFSFPQRL